MGAPLLHWPIPVGVAPASALPVATGLAPVWSLADLSGRLVELSADAYAAHLTAAFGLVLDAQIAGDRAAWVALEHSSFFPPDVAEGGVDLDALPVVRVPDVRMAGRAADHLVRSGGFGLVVLDLSTPGEPGGEKAFAQKHAANRFPVPLLTRLLGLARQQNVTVLLLTRKSPEDASLHSLIPLRVEATRHRREGRYELSVRVLKDKRSGARWTHLEPCRGPVGLP